MKKAKISYVTIVKNDRTGLFLTLRGMSFLREHHGVEVIVIDGSSKDLTTSDVAEIKALSDCYVSESDSGIYHAMNKGWRAAKGEYIGYVNAGDTPINSGMIELFENTKLGEDIVYGAMVVVDGNGDDRDALAWHHENLPRGTIPQPGTLVRKAVYEALNGFDESFKIAGDRDFFIRSKNAGFKLKFVPAFIIRFMAGGISSNFNVTRENFKIDMKYCKESKLRTALRFGFRALVQ